MRSNSIQCFDVINKKKLIFFNNLAVINNNKNIKKNTNAEILI